MDFLGTGNFSSKHYDPQERRTAIQQAIYWENQAMQLRAELFRADQTLQKFALRIAQQNRELAEYRRAFGPVGFNIPKEGDA